MRLEKGKMTRNMENHCGDFFKNVFSQMSLPSSLQVSLDQNAGSLNFTREFCSDKVNCSGSRTGTSTPGGLGAGTNVKSRLHHARLLQ